MIAIVLKEDMQCYSCNIFTLLGQEDDNVWLWCSECCIISAFQITNDRFEIYNHTYFYHQPYIHTNTEHAARILCFVTYKGM